jgi:hypothetical protein
MVGFVHTSVELVGSRQVEQVAPEMVGFMHTSVELVGS